MMIMIEMTMMMGMMLIADDENDVDDDDDMYIQNGKKIGADHLSAQKNWRKKCVNLDDKILRQKGIIHKK